jgi:sugar phosphate isomerase/epimerase
MSKTHQMKRGVSLYSYQEEYFLRKLSLEDCIATSAQLGACGIETLAEQMMPGFPHLSDGFYNQWHHWMAEYGTTPTCHDMFLDTKRHKGRLLTEDEQAESIVRDLKHANRLGCTVMRVLVSVSPDLLERCAPYAEQYNVRMGVEVHSPFHFDHPWILRHLDMMDRVGSPFLGFVPDMGIYIKRYPRVFRDRYVRNGANEQIADFICKAYEDRIFAEYVILDVINMGGNQIDIAMAESLRHNIWSSPKRLLEHMPRIFHIHAKFYEMLEDCTEYSIPYDEIIPVLAEGGYSGYLSSEYEGNRHIQDVFEVDSVEQVRRQQELFKRLLGETA